MGRNRHIPAVASAVTVLVGAVYLTVVGNIFRLQPAAPRTLRVGADNAAPYHTVSPHGLVSGMAVDILSRAASRKNIQLVWIPITTGTLEDALVLGKVDVWPAVSHTPGRDRILHFSSPWLESNYALVSRQEHEVDRSATTQITLAVADSPRVRGLAEKYFPAALRNIFPTNIEAVRAVCRSATEAALLDARVLDSVLLDRPEGCGRIPFRVHFVPEAANPVSLAGRRDAAALIDDLRDGITPLFTDGTFAAALDKWSGFSGAQTRAYFELRETQLRTRAYLWLLVLMLVTAVVLAWQIVKQRKVRRSAVENEVRFSAFMNHSPLVGFIKNEEGRLIYANRKFSDVFRPTIGDFIGKCDYELWPYEAAAKIRCDDLKVIETGIVTEMVDSVPASDGTMMTWLSTKFRFSIGGDRFLGGMSVEITDRESAKEALRASEDRFRSAFENATVGMAVTDRAGRFLEANRAYCEITGYSVEELIQTDSLSITHPDDRGADFEARQRASEGDQSGFRLEKRYVRKDGSLVWVRLSVGIVYDINGIPCHNVALVEDITREKQSKEDARIGERRWQLALQAATDGIWDWDGRGNTVFFSPRWKEMLGYSDHDLPNRPEVWELLLHPEDRGPALATVDAHLAGNTPDYRAEYRMRCNDGQYKWVLARGQAIWDENGKPIRLIGTHTDITERKVAEEQLLYLAQRDPLTGLLNRRQFLSLFRGAMTGAMANGQSLTFCVCDLDRFKDVNDRYGHQAGDEVLIAFSNAVTDNIKPDDLAGRIGGDEFWVLLRDTNSCEALSCMERIRVRLESASFSGGSAVFSVTASFGVADLRSAHELTGLIEAADRALYSAKARGRNAAAVFRSDLEKLDSVSRQCPAEYVTPEYPVSSDARNG